MERKRVLAIIGLGPRGSYALENLVVELASRDEIRSIEIHLFESSSCPGNGPVYDINQAESNWINISERILKIDARPDIDLPGLSIPGFPSFHEWSNRDSTEIPPDVPDYYPPRSLVGNYLQQRFESLATSLQQSGTARIILAEVEKLSLNSAGDFQISTKDGKTHYANEVLLTIGHQPTYPTKEMLEWKDHAGKYSTPLLFSSPYPVEQFLEGNLINPSSKIAIQGFGLSMIDVVRAIAEKFGEFKVVSEDNASLRYVADGSLENLLLPFSLDGLPMSPKPLNAQLDKLYQPDSKQLQVFEQTIGDPQVQKAADSPAFLIESIADITATIYHRILEPGNITLQPREIINVTSCWLTDESFTHQLIVPQSQPPDESMKQFVDMARGSGKISLDYCIGQVWRHCQPSIYRQLSFNQCSDRVFAEILELDERMKRYAFGPPVESIQQLLSLIVAGVMNLKWVKDPNISLSPAGWILQTGEEESCITADVMISAILASPEVNSICSPLVKNLLQDELIQLAHDDFGIVTKPDGYVVSPAGNPLPLAVLGRLAKGTIIGVDALLECFGPRIRIWAKAAADRHVKCLDKDPASEKLNSDHLE